MKGKLEGMEIFILDSSEVMPEIERELVSSHRVLPFMTVAAMALNSTSVTRTTYQIFLNAL